MYIRDHSRPKLYEAFGMDITEFDYRVFDITTEISKQVFPLTLNTDDPRFKAGLKRMLRLSNRSESLRQQGGFLNMLKRVGLTVASGATFARLFFLPVTKNELPEEVLAAPAW
jgi:magnesium-protoporphyrin IX monomethyl ester (oxidative) cyclase